MRPLSRLLSPHAGLAVLAALVGGPASPALGGELSATAKKGELRIIGSDDADVFEVVGLGAGEVQVRCAPGTTVNGKAKKTFGGVLGDVTIKTKKGDDFVAVLDLYVGDDLRVRVDGGHDRVLLFDVYVEDDLLVLGENGRDAIELIDVYVDGDCSVKGGKKIDDIAFVDCVFGGDFVLRAGNGDDDVFVEACVFYDDSLFDLGHGYDELQVGYGTSYLDDVDFDGGDEVDVLLLGAVSFWWGIDVDVDDFEYLFY